MKREITGKGQIMRQEYHLDGEASPQPRYCSIEVRLPFEVGQKLDDRFRNGMLFDITLSWEESDREKIERLEKEVADLRVELAHSRPRPFRHDVHRDGIQEHTSCPDPANCSCECLTCKRVWFEAGRPKPH
jgi:hypothetical protein